MRTIQVVKKMLMKNVETVEEKIIGLDEEFF